MRELRGKVAVITGGASGIGRAMAERFAAEGMRLVLADVEAASLARAAAELEKDGAEVIGVETDVRHRQALEQLAERALERFGRVHVVCNNAGVAPMGSILGAGSADWQWVLDVNLMGVVHGLDVFAPLLIEQGEGHIVNTASASGLAPTPGLGAYTASKYAVVGLSETLYIELRDTGVGLSLLCPGLVSTRILSSERNRPDDGGPADYGELQRGAQAAMLEAGAPPARIAEAVLQAIREERFYVLPSPELQPVILERFRCIETGANPRREDAPALGDIVEEQPA
jgi:NAD(P)-dependent dehydrogenase (short-subunit alcohol dehydrogenase family)